MKAAFDRVIVAPVTVRSSPTDTAESLSEIEPVTISPSAIVTSESVSEILPERESVVIPERAPPVVTSKAVESIATVSPPSPRVTTPLAVSVPLVVVVPETVRDEEAVVASERVIDEVPESITMFPVVDVPRVRDCITVVDNVPVALRYDPPAAPAESVAVGVPELIFITANLADAVEVAPIAKSTVRLFGNRSPAEDCCQNASTPPAAQEPKKGVVPPSKHWVEVPAVTWANTPDPFVYRGPPFDVKVENVIVPSAVMLPSPVAFPVVEISQSEESMATVSPLSPRVTTPLAVRVPETVRDEEAVVASDKVIDEVPESITMFPVVAPPRVKDCMAVVERVPVALRYDPPAAPAESVAVGVPELIFITANLADAVLCPPIAKSTVELSGTIAPDDS